MQINVQGIMKDIKTWIALAAVAVGITVAAIGWAKMPERVTDVEARVGKTEDQVQQLAASVDKYIAVQAEQKKADKEKEELLLRLIEKMSTK